MKIKILLIGKNGQVGSELAALLPRLGQVIALGRQELDLSKPHDIRLAIDQARPGLIVNAAAYTAVDQAENDESTARAINSDAPAVMAEQARKLGAGLVHYSTDYVFDGLKNSPYVEDDPPHPINAYGRTKLAGEEAIRDSGVPHLIFRTAWVYATAGRNFLLTILRLAAQRQELRIVADQHGAPTWSREIARATSSAIERLLEQNTKDLSLHSVSGTYHMTAAGTTNWHAFASEILDQASQIPSDCPWFASATSGRPLLASRLVPITTAAYPTPARRPTYSVLSNVRLAKTFGVELPDWRTQLRLAFSPPSVSSVEAPKTTT